MREFFFISSSTRISSPRAYSARSESATRKALARVSAGTSPEPCQSTGVTSAPSALSRAGRKRVSPALWRNSRVSRAQGMGSAVSVCPPSSSSAARAKISKVTMVEDGLPGRPKKNLPRARPKTSGWPGWISTRSKKNSAPKSASTSSTTSYLPAETPPESSSRSASSPRSTISRVCSTVSRATGRIRGTPPARATCAASEYALELRIWKSAGVSSTSTISSPVAMMATLGLAVTRERAAGRTRPAWRCRCNPGACRRAARSRRAAASQPRGLMNWRGSAARSMRTRPSPAACASTITTASAPAGTGAPVMISTAWPGPTVAARTARPRALRRSPQVRPADRRRAPRSRRAPSARAPANRGRRRPLRPARGRPRPPARRRSTSGAGCEPATLLSTVSRATWNVKATLLLWLQ